MCLEENIWERKKVCLLWDKMLALCSYWGQRRSAAADSRYLLTLPIMLPQAESPQCAGLLLLYSSPLWNYRRALSLCSLKQELLLKIKAGWKRNRFCLSQRTMFERGRQLVLSPSVSYLAHLFLHHVFISNRFSNNVICSFTNF